MCVCRSFDHLLGYLKRVNPEIDGLVGNETNPFDPANPAAGYATVSDDSGYVTDPDPGVRGWLCLYVHAGAIAHSWCFV
jgi:hypothetical protein